MKKSRIFQYFILMLAVFFLLLCVNLIIRTLIYMSNDTDRMPSRANSVKKELLISDSGDISLSDDAKARLKSKGELAMIISNNGNVIWSIDKPDEIPDTYTVSEVAAFSHWYLKDYPVYTAILNDGILVVGEPKGSVWRYNLVFGTGDLASLLKIFPFVILVEMLLAIVIPFFILKKQEKTNEKERVQWISGVSHDIRTPLSLILGSAQGIMENAEDDDIYTKAVSIKNNTLRIKGLVTNLNTENILSFGVKKSQDKINLSGLIKDTICAAMEQEEDGIFNAEFEASPELEDMSIRADEGLVKRMFENISLNCMTHNPTGCNIKISMLPVSKTDSEIGKLLFNKKSCVVIIRDDGAGAGMDMINKLNSGPDRISLTDHGLGLIVVKKIASLYNWKIEFSSDNGFVCKIKIR